MMITDVIVLLSIVFAVVFFAGWLIRPDLRSWIERPKYRFQANVQSYDQARRTESDSAKGAHPHDPA